jgi:hypothetical protein
MYKTHLSTSQPLKYYSFNFESLEELEESLAETEADVKLKEIRQCASMSRSKWGLLSCLLSISRRLEAYVCVWMILAVLSSLESLHCGTDWDVSIHSMLL